MTQDPPTRRLWAVLCTALGLVLAGGALAAFVQTSGGSVSVRDTRFMGDNGQMMSGLLYVPEGTSAKNPAPGILAVHGYVNSRETQDAYAIEFARRGYVVLAIDQAGHGFSDAPAMQNGFGGPAGLRYLHSLDIVDKNNIGLEGHSLGGQAIQAAAATYPTYYRSMALVGSWTTAPAAVSPALKNVAVITGRWEEFSPLMWEVADSTDINGSPRMKKLFGTTGEVQPGKLHGSIADGTARILYRPTTNHPGNTADPASVGHAVEWMDRTLDGGHKATGQVWWAKELGTLLAFIGGVLFLFPFGALLLRRRVFAPVVRDVPEAKGARSGAPWYVTALVSAAIPAVTFFWFQQKGAEWIKPSALFPQELTNGVMVWALLNGLISLVLLAAWHLLGNRRAGVRLRDYGLAWEDGFHLSRVGRAALLAVAVTGGLYGLLAASDWLFHTDFRFYVLQLHLMDGAHLRIFLSYLLPFTAFFLVLSAGLHSQLRAAGSRRRTRGEMVAAAVVLPVGIAVLILVDYLPLLLTGTKLAVPTQPLLIIIGYQFVPLLAVAGLVSTYFFHRTGTVYTGAFVSAIVITWSMTAGTATHVPIGQWDGVAQLARVLVPLVAGVALIAVPLLRRRSTARHAASGTPGTPGTLSEAGTTV